MEIQRRRFRLIRKQKRKEKVRKKEEEKPMI
jgi:hypothetical protein